MTHEDEDTDFLEAFGFRLTGWHFWAVIGAASAIWIYGIYSILVDLASLVI